MLITARRRLERARQLSPHYIFIGSPAMQARRTAPFQWAAELRVQQREGTTTSQLQRDRDETFGVHRRAARRQVPGKGGRTAL